MIFNIFKEKLPNPFDLNKTAGENFKALMKWVYCLRSLILAIPVAITAIILAVNSSRKLPGPLQVGAGNDVITVSKSLLVMGPLALTVLCILMMLFSKRVTYPWLISLFTLVLPVILVFTMTFGM